jgi:hypothetical protein
MFKNQIQLFQFQILFIGHHQLLNTIFPLHSKGKVVFSSIIEQMTQVMLLYLQQQFKILILSLLFQWFIPIEPVFFIFTTVKCL